LGSACREDSHYGNDGVSRCNIVFDKATVNEASKSASADVVECYRDFQACTETSTITVTDQFDQALDAALFQMSGTTLTVTPTLASQIASVGSPVVVRVTQAVNQVDISNNQITVVWDAANIIIECTITRFDVPTLPVTTQYLINSGPLVINVAPAFAQ